ncbi:GGDEF domain-containing protein [Dactylosporangium sp. NPDC049742]|uniref:GGDEF domain-containing protein n=1 Tax=Dactylosporangium sp. NPDC049742 TaxID=3154737 RepID=UPI003419E603
MIPAAAGPGEVLAVLLLDLDGFKPVNDTHGHAAGDLMLTAVARRFAAAVRPGDTVARLGGDEFGVVLAALGSPVQADEIAARLVARAAEPVPSDGRDLRVGAGAGIALARGPGHPPDRLLESADDALCEAKAAGRNRARRARTTVPERRGLSSGR